MLAHPPQATAGGNASGALMAQIQSTTMGVLAALGSSPAAAPLAAELAVWRGGLAECRVGARSDRSCEHPPLARLDEQPRLLRSAVAAPLAAVRKAAREMSLKLQTHDVDGAVPFSIGADEQITHHIATLAGEVPSAPS